MDPSLSISTASQIGISLPYCKQLLTDLYSACRLCSTCIVTACTCLMPTYACHVQEFSCLLISHAGKYLHRLIAFGNNNAQKYLRPIFLEYIFNRTRKYNYLRIAQICAIIL